MMKNAIIVIVVLIVLGGGYFLFASKQNNKPATTSPQPSTVMPSQDSMKSSPAPSAASISAEVSGTMGAVKEFTVSGSNFKFEPSTLTVNKGDKVKITFKNSGGMHNFTLDEFNAKTPVIQSGAEATVAFTADKAGTFKYYCSVGNHRAMGMEGTFTVK